MAIFAVADLHLSLSEDKPMDVFGGGWEGYLTKLEKNWASSITAQDTVLIPGDISWAMHINNAYEDFKYLDSLPGRKIIAKGNHDYWWDTASKIKRFFTEHDIKSIEILHNNSFFVDNAVICGSRGWRLKNSADFSDHDQKIYNREIERLKASVRSARAWMEKAEMRIIMLHYPPFNMSNKENEFIDVITEHETDICLFGHIHSNDMSDEYNCEINGVNYRLISGDHLKFAPYRII